MKIKVEVVEIEVAEVADVVMEVAEGEMISQEAKDAQAIKATNLATEVIVGVLPENQNQDTPVLNLNRVVRALTDQDAQDVEIN